MDWLADIRRKKGLSQIRVAQQAKITQPTYCNIENGARRPSVKVAKKIAQILAFDWTLFFEENKENCKKQTAS